MNVHKSEEAYTVTGVRLNCPQYIKGLINRTKSVIRESCMGKLRTTTISVSLALELLMLASLFTYAVTSHTYGLKEMKLRGRYAMKIRKQTTKMSDLEGEVQEYQKLIHSFSKKGKRKALGTFTITAYDPVESCKPFDDGITASLIPAGMGIAAVDPRMIPYGSVLYIPELDRYFFACDTGSAMKRGDGKNIDILMPTVDDALQFGRRRMKVELVDLSHG